MRKKLETYIFPPLGGTGLEMEKLVPWEHATPDGPHCNNVCHAEAAIWHPVLLNK